MGEKLEMVDHHGFHWEGKGARKRLCNILGCILVVETCLGMLPRVLVRALTWLSRRTSSMTAFSWCMRADGVN